MSAPEDTGPEEPRESAPLRVQAQPVEAGVAEAAREAGPGEAGPGMPGFEDAMAAKARLREAVAEAVAQANGQGRAVSAEEVLAGLSARGILPQDQEGRLLVESILRDSPNLASFASVGGEPVFHDPALLSATYARIIDRRASPMLLMAGEIRANSRDYPRPVPVGLFASPPFGLTPEEIAAALRDMAADPAFADISFTTTADGAVYLFSLQSLEPGYARFLAEHAQSVAMNP